jgi:hypothetical protein
MNALVYGVLLVIQSALQRSQRRSALFRVADLLPLIPVEVIAPWRHDRGD